MKSLILISIILMVGLAHGEEETYGYESILKDLSSSTSHWRKDRDIFSQIEMHGGMGMTTSYLNLENVAGENIDGFLRGFEANFGIDLFSPQWLAEGSVRSYGSAEINPQTHVSLKEFDLKFVYRSRLSGLLKFKAGIGLASRYLKVKHANGSSTSENRYTTPSSIMMLGLDANIAKGLSIGTDFAYRSAMIEETVDRSAVGAGLRLDAHF